MTEKIEERLEAVRKKLAEENAQLDGLQQIHPSMVSLDAIASKLRSTAHLSGFQAGAEFVLFELRDLLSQAKSLSK